MPKYKVAFIGRSNVGKSSLINYLLGQNFAKTSKHPGKTRKHDIFSFNDKIDFVDMPGYGYASVHGKKREIWEDVMQELFFEDDLFKQLFVLIDSSIAPGRVDQDYINWLIENRVGFSIIFTKTDKAEAKKIALNIKNWTTLINLLPSSYGSPTFFQVSSLKKKGAQEITKFLNEMDFETN